MVKKTVEGVDAVFHEAALVSVTCSVEDPLLSNEINVTGTLNLLKACADVHVKRFVSFEATKSLFFVAVVASS